MLASLNEMAITKANFTEALRIYHRACEAKDWPAVETARFGVISALEASMDAVASTYRLMEEAAKGGNQ